MPSMASTAAALHTELRHVADPSAYPNRHSRGGAAIPGVRMGTLFDIAKRHSAMPLVEVGTLLDRAEYEPRLAAFCVLDFQVRRPPASQTQSGRSAASSTSTATTRSTPGTCRSRGAAGGGRLPAAEIVAAVVRPRRVTRSAALAHGDDRA